MYPYLSDFMAPMKPFSKSTASMLSYSKGIITLFFVSMIPVLPDLEAII